MARKSSFRIEGLKDLDAALAALPKATGKRVLRRAGFAAMEPMREKAEAGGPNLTGQLQTHVAVSSRQKGGRALRRAREEKDTVTVYMGPTRAAAVQGQQQEFGNRNHGPQPFMRPAWDQEKTEVPGRVGEELWPQIEKAAARLARKQARLLKKSGG